MSSPPSQVDRIRKAASAGRRSALYRWMNANFDVFAATVAESGKPNWSELAKVFAEEKLWDTDGNPANAERARLTWLQVRKTRDGKKAKGRASTETRLNASVPVPTPSPKPQPKPQPVQPVTVAPPKPAERQGAQTDLERVLEEMAERSRKMPDPLKE